MFSQQRLVVTKNIQLNYLPQNYNAQTVQLQQCY